MKGDKMIILIVGVIISAIIAGTATVISTIYMPDF
jgi:hypothetical protein